MTPSGRGRLRSQDGPARRRSDDGWTYVRPKRSNTAPPAPSQAATAKGTPEKGQSRSPAICCAFKAYASDQHPRQARWSAPERSSGNGGLGPWVHLPIPGKQVGDFVGGVIWKPCQHVSEPDLGIDVVHLAGFDQGVDGGGTVAARVRTGKGPVSSSDRHTSQRSFSGVVRKTDAAVVEEAGERCPAVEKVVDRLGGIVLGGEQRSLPSWRSRSAGRSKPGMKKQIGCAVERSNGLKSRPISPSVALCWSTPIIVSSPTRSKVNGTRSSACWPKPATIASAHESRISSSSMKLSANG